MGHPWTDVTFVGVYWNDPERVDRLLKHVRPWFTNLVVGVQSDSMTDDTLDRARETADIVIVDAVAGFCEPTINKVLSVVKTEWSFLVSADEWPSDQLLSDFQAMVNMAESDDYVRLEGFWIRMLSTIEGVAYPSEQDNHLRVFRSRLGWPATMHSRPPASQTAFWNPDAYLRHDRSLDEMMVDYLRYYRLGQKDSGWVAHNKVMMHDACAATAEHYGWDHIRKYEWWPQVRDIAFGGQEPE